MSAWFAPYRWDDDPTMLALRKRIHRAHLMCLERAERAKCDEAGELFLLAMHIASSWLYQRTTEERLADAVTLLAYLWNAADAIERLEAADVD
jgi:hypothetical protein